MPDRSPVLGIGRNAVTRLFNELLRHLARAVRIAAIGALTPGSMTSEGLLTGLGRRRILSATVEPFKLLFPVRRGASSPLESFIVDHTDAAWEETLTAEGTRMRDVLGQRRAAALAAGNDDLATLLEMANAGVDRRLAAARAFNDVTRWQDSRGYTLSDRVWDARAATRLAIDRELRLSIARGDDALDVAKRLEGFLAPGNAATTRTPGRGGTGNAAARRLARTELSRSYNQSAVTSAAANPFVKGMRYVLSGSHPKADRCSDLAQADGYGLGAGCYPIGSFPTPPIHPNCLCHSSPLVMSGEDRRRLLRQRYGFTDGENRV